MGRIHPERPNTDPFDRSVSVDVLLRQEPDEEEEEDQGDGKDDDNDDDQGDEDDEGYSEVSVPRSSEQLALSSTRSQCSCGKLEGVCWVLAGR
jgi:hypothetical protein